ncbi:LysM peptidoglycan-binding domain-containing protein [Pontibacter diazotrophicus]|uniref:LysM peptidoglycan-binding domain-containing protein n=1 Tax=Pontibacter diazotrophicus TaxID=1400979 RepID=A0A3D8L739_9BACT|nr:lytic transglycosylase domain-containing protein [Pontibacter diazotrophicus]RDV13211.1 LysM peptidoglycan-binding domain-containing protein [Pontibacter diazotrophicus]
MTYTKFFTLLTAVVCSVWGNNTPALGHGRLLETPFTAVGDTLKGKTATTSLSPEEEALLVEHIPNVPNDLIADRLSCIETEIPLEFNNYVRNFIDYFTIRNRKYSRMMLTRENVYFPMYEKYLKKHNMPMELKYLSIVESGLNPKAQSPVGAAGLWQFMKPTAGDFGLKFNQYIDERLDPEKSTEAALKFLRRLHNTYGDWELAMAAYNCGPGNVNKAIRKAGGGKKTFWEIFPYLPKETRGYIPSMTAVIYTMHHAGDHNIFSDSILYQPQVAYLEVTQELDLDRLAAELHVTPAELMALNPEIKSTTIPKHLRNYKLRIPAERAPLLASVEDKSCIMLAAAPVSEPVRRNEPAETPVLLASAKTEKPADKKAGKATEKAVDKEDETAIAGATPAADKKLTYTVQRGDNLTQIALRHQVTIAQLKEWNDLKGSSIKPDQKLVIYKQATAEEEPVLLASNEEVQPAAKATTKQVKESVQAEQVIHHVQPGDTLWNISRKYDGISIEQIKKLNKLKSDNLKPGQKLILS